MSSLKFYSFQLIIVAGFWLCGALSSHAATAQIPLHHSLIVELLPDEGYIKVEDQITFPQRFNAAQKLQFSLHPGLVLSADTAGVKQNSASRGLYNVTLPAVSDKLTISYSGRLQQKLRDISDSPGRAQQHTRGWIGAEGVFLDGSAPWYPLFDDHMVSFDLRVSAPEGWSVVSQGENLSSAEVDHWQELQPQDDIYLIANQFKHYQKQSGDVLAEVYLKNQDAALAEKYLEATEKYLTLYTQMLGAYPYQKFALVENFWETGYGMPSFTLLGPQVIRLPFIVHTSYPHEILHNWFGNGVYVDYSQGNWSEGLTTYLADHWLKQQRNKGADYRRNALQGYASYVAETNEFPLTGFRARHGDSSQAIGYGKAMMMFHMLRQQLGDDLFFEGLQTFYQKNKFKRATYTDLQKAWEQVSQQSLQPFFSQWLNRTGAPQLSISSASVEKKGEQYHLKATLQQTQKEAVFDLNVPVRIQFGDGSEAVQKTIAMSKKSQQIEIELLRSPTWVNVDSDFDLFRRLDPAEIPPTLSAMFGSEELLIVLPSNTSDGLKQGYRRLAEAWLKKRHHGWKIMLDTDVQSLPEDKAVLLLGWDNTFRPRMLAAEISVSETENALVLNQERIDPNQKSIVLALESTQKKPLVFLSASEPQAIPGLARKIPHYGKYSYLVFDGAAPTNQLKGQWQAGDSPLRVCIPPADADNCGGD